MRGSVRARSRRHAAEGVAGRRGRRGSSVPSAGAMPSPGRSSRVRASSTASRSRRPGSPPASIARASSRSSRWMGTACSRSSWPRTLRVSGSASAVGGNNDRGPWAEALPLIDVVPIGDVSLYLLHDLHELDLEPRAAGFAAVISGHSHQPRMDEKDGVLYLNPGSAGPRRFKLPISIARLTVRGANLRAEIIPLSDLRHPNDPTPLPWK